MKWPTLFPPRPHDNTPPPPPDNTTDTDNTDIESLPPPSPHPKTLPPTPHLTPSQALYILLLDGLGAAVLSGAINFALAFAMYTTPPPTAPPIRLWALPNTLAGDAAVTILVQCLITWILELLLVARDLERHSIAPIGFLAEPKGGVGRWFFLLDRERKGWRWWGAQVVRAGTVGAGCFVLVWPVAVGVLVGVGRKEGGDYVFERRWAPQVFKLVLGAVVGGLTTPGVVVFWLARAGWGWKGEGGGEGAGEGGVEGRPSGLEGRASDEETVVDGGEEGGGLDGGGEGKK
ncbi:hypothetical protein QBC39DRAFT_404764 [Podospora conica]|nr:hypothetical protein QBC39DRAFT_404764 [Schizothecium conicum]